MYPYLIRFGGITVVSYSFFYGLGMAVAGLLFAAILHHRGVSLRKSAILFMVCGGSIIVGGRLMYAVVYWDSVRKELWEFANLKSGGQILYGSLLVGMAAMFILLRILRLSGKEVADAAAVVIPLGLAIGRIGCFCRGCCHGSVTGLPWGITFPKVIDVNGQIIGSHAYLMHLENHLISMIAPRSLPVHPVELYESLTMLALFVILLTFWQSRIFAGRLAALFLLAYCVTRFVLEFVRVEPQVLAGLTIYQILSIAIAVCTAAWLALALRKHESTTLPVAEARRKHTSR